MVGTHMIRKIIFCICFVFSFTVSISLHADEAREIEMGTDTYKEVTLETVGTYLVRSGYWNLLSPEVMADYARIFQCEIYQDFYSDEHEWKNISQVMRQQLEKSFKGKKLIERRKGKMFFTSNIRLERYDFSAKGFFVHPQDRLNKIQKFEFFSSFEHHRCGKRMSATSMPRRMFLRTEQPFSLDFIDARDTGIFERISDIPVVSGSKQVRNMTAVFMFSFEGFDTSDSFQCSEGNCLDLIGDLDYVAFYVDKELKEPLHIIKVPKEKDLE